jgi:hypothetical protein
VREPTAFEFELIIEKLNGHKSRSTDQFPGEMIKAEGRIIRSEIHYRINSILNKDELPGEWMESIIVPIYKVGD